MQHHNNHGELLERIAFDLGEEYYGKAFSLINGLTHLEGYLIPDVASVRERFRQNLKARLDRILEENDRRVLQYI